MWSTSSVMVAIETTERRPWLDDVPPDPLDDRRAGGTSARRSSCRRTPPTSLGPAGVWAPGHPVIRVGDHLARWLVLTGGSPTLALGDERPRAMTDPPTAYVRTGLSVRLAIALAFADASVVVLALPQIIERLHTSISHVTWVITAYNLALIACTIAIVPFGTRLASRPALVAGLAVFGLASLGSGAAGSLLVLVLWRCVQGGGAALLLCASLPLFAGERRAGTSVLQSWAATAAVGAAVGPAAGGILTQLFDWRAIFLAQAPVAAVAALTTIAVTTGAPSTDPDASGSSLEAASTGRDDGAASLAAAEHGARSALFPSLANMSLAFVSAGLIGALFLATVMLINVWQLSPLGAAAVLAMIPVATIATERVMRSRPAAVTAAVGAVVLAVGLVLLALISHRELVLTLVALGLCGAGLGLAFPALTRVALETRGPLVARAARTVASREGGLVLGLVLLTPVLVSQLNAAPGRAVAQVTSAIIDSPVSLATKIELGAGLAAANARTPQSQLPDFGPPFARAAAGQSTATKKQLAELELQVQGIVQRAVTRSFRGPLLLCALLSMLALAPLAYGWRRSRRE
jgi:MFS family permease